MTPIAFQEATGPLRERLHSHPLYHDLSDVASIRIFMKHHIYAVWDFMSLLKALQQRLSCVSIPWIPGTDDDCTRIINEIVLAEESDQLPGGEAASHYHIYRRAMSEIGADASGIDELLSSLSRGSSLQKALSSSSVPDAARRFCECTFSFISSGNLACIAAAFLSGRESVLPGICQRLVEDVATVHGASLVTYQYYLMRHIEIDGDKHSKQAEKLLARICQRDISQWEAAEHASVVALQARLDFWDAIHAEVVSHRRQNIAS